MIGIIIKIIQDRAMKKTVVLKISLLIFISIYVGNSSPSSAAKDPLPRRKYVDPRGVFSFDFTGEWRVVKNTDKPDVLGWYLVSNEEMGKKTVTAEVIITRVGLEDGLTFEDYLQVEDMNLLEKLPDRGRILERENKLVDGNPATRRIFFLKSRDQKNRLTSKLAMQYYINRPDSVWGITVITLPKYREMFFDIEETMFSSFKFLTDKYVPSVQEISEVMVTAPMEEETDEPIEIAVMAEEIPTEPTPPETEELPSPVVEAAPEETPELEKAEDAEIIIPESEQVELPATVEMVIESDIPQPESTADQDRTPTVPADLIPDDPDAATPITDETKVKESITPVKAKPKTNKPMWSPKNSGSE